jgi:hypothetical protein
MALRPTDARIFPHAYIIDLEDPPSATDVPSTVEVGSTTIQTLKRIFPHAHVIDPANPPLKATDALYTVEVGSITIQTLNKLQSGVDLNVLCPYLRELDEQYNGWCRAKTEGKELRVKAHRFFWLRYWVRFLFVLFTLLSLMSISVHLPDGR